MEIKIEKGKQINIFIIQSMDSLAIVCFMYAQYIFYFVETNIRPNYNDKNW